MTKIRVGIVGDTHCPQRVPLKALPSIIEAMQGCDYIIHIGDVSTKDVLSQLEAIAPTYAVRGNDEIDTNDLPDKLVITIGDVRIGLHHGHRPFMTEFPSRIKTFLGLNRGMDWAGIQEWLLEKFKNDNVHVIVFGHFHVQYNAYHNGTLLINSGSIYKSSHDALAYRMRHSTKLKDQLMSKIEYRMKKYKVSKLPTIAILEIDGFKLEAKIIEFPKIQYEGLE